ncbi:MAG: hypothetical protein ACJ786_38770 [Catenulispora sp.]
MLLNEPTPHTVLTITEEAGAPPGAEAETTRIDVIGVAGALSASGGASDSAGNGAEGEADAEAGAEAVVSADTEAEAVVSADAASAVADSGEPADRPDSAAPPEQPSSGELVLRADAEPAPGPESARADSAENSPSADTPTVSFRRPSTTVALPETVAEVVAVVDAASRAIAAAEDAARVVAAAHEREAARRPAPPTTLDLREPAPPAPVDGVLDLLAPVLQRPLLVVEQPELPSAPDLMALHRAEFEQDFAEPPVVPAGDEPPIPVRFGPGLAVLPHIEFPV